jgi:hypothetical protein
MLYNTLVYGIELPALVVSAINRKTDFRRRARSESTAGTACDETLENVRAY